MRNQFAKVVSKVLKEDDNAVVLLGDISHFLLRDAQTIAPDRLYNIGICEQAMVSMASGMAIEGMRPIVHTIAPFLVERAYEQIKVGVGYQQTDVTIITVGGTYDYADLGCTHHCYSDIALMRSIPGMEVYEPGNAKEFEQLFEQTWANGKPKYFRLSAKSHNQSFDVTPHEVVLVRPSSNNTYVFVCGHILDDVLMDSEVGIFYVPTLSHISPTSMNLIANTIDNQSRLISVENHFKNGGLGDLISETFTRAVYRIGLSREFITEYGSYEELREVAGMSTDQILQKIKAITNE